MTDDESRLGLDRAISRRDFLDGVALAVGGAIVGPHLSPALLHAGVPVQGAAPYPPALTGLRGSHVGSFEAFHALKDGRYWASAPTPTDSGEAYDLIVVGAGISGLAAAHYYRRQRPDARILILDNHDDFGGHAKRNEFMHDGRLHIGYGGTQSIDSPAPYSAVARALIEELGIDVSRYLREYLDRDLYAGHKLESGFFFDRERYGADRLLKVDRRRPSDAFIAAAPVSAATKRDLRRLRTEMFDPYPGLTSSQKKARLARISYAAFLTDLWKVDVGVVAILQNITHPLFGAGIDVVPAQDAHGLRLPGFQGMRLDAAAGPGQNYDSIIAPGTEGFYFHFPDGNAAIARLLVRRLIPAAIPGSSATDVVTARADYAQLDREGAPVRIRLGSPVMRVRHLGDPARARTTEVTWLKDGSLRTARGGSVVLACWHQVIPHLCSEFPTAQREAMTSATKVPLVYTNVLIRDWSAFVKLGVRSIATPGLWHDSIALDFPVSMGEYRHPRRPGEPIVLHLAKSVCRPGLPIRAQHLAGRGELLTTSFETIERSIRSDLARVLGPGGFDPARDILGITVNRWPHGYAYQYNSLADDFWLEGGEQPCAVARRPLGRIAIANADAGAYSYTDAAIDRAHRAVQELLGPR